jgi:hypothetical protein
MQSVEVEEGGLLTWVKIRMAAKKPAHLTVVTQ